VSASEIWDRSLGLRRMPRTVEVVAARWFPRVTSLTTDMDTKFGGVDLPSSPPRTVTTLENGLTVIVEEVHYAPVVSGWAWYRVGSRNEVSGITGASHWVEHLLFKPTKQFPDDSRDRQVACAGGVANGFTWLDETTYYATVPKGDEDLLFRIEADRLANSVFDPEVIETERTVIISERQGGENQPTLLLSEEVSAAAFRVHSYGHDTIGHLCDLETMTPDDLLSHYNRYYVPGNATIVVVGDCEAKQVLGRITELFGQILAGDPIPEARCVEPPQRGERRVVVNGDGATSYLQIAYHGPKASDPDFFPTAVACTLLGDAGSFMFDSRPNSRSSRLWKALVDGGLTADVSVSFEPTIDPGLIVIGTTALPQVSLEAVEQSVDDIVHDMCESVVPAAELEKAKKQSRAALVLGSETITNRALALGMAATVASLEWLDGYDRAISAVTTEDIRRVANRYLIDDNRVVGQYRPTGATGGRE